YPYLSDVVEAITGVHLPLPFATFGLLVGIAALVAASVFGAELKRLYLAGRIGTVRKRVRGADVEVPPQDIVTDMVMLVLIAGVIGARVFHIFEHLDEFAANPLAMIFSRSGLSIFGGLIFGTITGVLFVRRYKLPPRVLMDAVAPAMMLGYGIGRIGCQVSGDGDWGIASNMALKPDWLPTWLWAQTYDHNIFGAVIAAPGVYPTPMYETAMALACFALLWALRRHPFQAGWLFSLYLLLAGVERLLVEQIRVNPVLDFGLVHATQAEMIAATLIAAGAAGLAMLGRRTAPALGGATSA
ncbi:MAG: prolipoprotein diacylglyceryl transferase, partial [Telluria sp.]